MTGRLRQDHLIGNALLRQRDCLNCDLCDFWIALIIQPLITVKGLDSGGGRNDGLAAVKPPDLERFASSAGLSEL